MAAPSASTDESAREVFLRGRRRTGKGATEMLMAFDVLVWDEPSGRDSALDCYCHEKLSELDMSLAVCVGTVALRRRTNGKHRSCHRASAK